MSSLQFHPGDYQNIDGKLTCSHRGVSIDGMLSFSVGSSLLPCLFDAKLISISQLISRSLFRLRMRQRTQRVLSWRGVRNDSGRLTLRVRTDGRKMESRSRTLSGCEKWSAFPSHRQFRGLTVRQLDGRLPASPLQISGIVAIQIHQLSGLDSPFSTPPAVYCRVFANDEKVLQTPIKKTASPYFESRSSTEFFCRDWRKSKFTIAVMESRELGEDRIIGTLTASGKTTFEKTSQSTKCVSRTFHECEGTDWRADGSRWILGMGGYEFRCCTNRSTLSFLLVSPISPPLAQNRPLIMTRQYCDSETSERSTSVHFEWFCRNKSSARSP